MNKAALNIAGITEKDYKMWCKENKKAPYKSSTKVEFFTRIVDGRLVKNEDGKLVKKYKTK